MKRIIIAAVIAAAFVATAFSQETAAAPISVQQELRAALQELSAAQLGTLTVGDLEKVAERVSIATQKIQYVQKARMASFMLPGAGQFMTGDALGGSLFVAGDLTVAAGTLLGAYFLLPTNVQFSSLNWFTAPLSNVRTTFESNSFVQYLPSLGVMAGGMLLTAVLRHFSAGIAARDAWQNIQNGKVTFTPTLGFLDRGFGVGMRMRF
ncbi:MAG: hypothetical protein ABSF77_09525 [Spirochaetia bacterium]|jgi:hypothetical protein